MTTLLTVKDVSKRLSMHKQTITKYCREGVFPNVKVGRQYRFTPEHIEAFVKNLEKMGK